MLSVHEVASQLKVSDQHIRNVPIEPDDYPRQSGQLPEMTALSFFSGAMGLDIGMERGGIKALLACECDKSCRLTIHKNKPEIGLIGDIDKYSSAEILSFAGIPQGHKVDVIFGGPPCQAFSTAGTRRGLSDSRGNVFLKYIDIITEIQPRYAVIENVRGLLSAEFPYSDSLSPEQSFAANMQPIKGGVLLHILKKLRAAGYTVSFDLYNAANFGAPQIRERVVIIAHQGADKVPYLTPTHAENGAFGLPRWKTLAEALSRLPDTTGHRHVNFPEERLRYYRVLKEGQYWKNLPLELQKEAMGKSFYLGGGKTGFYRRLRYDSPSPTLVTHPAMPATDLAHPVEDRPLSVEEYSAIQEFPRSWTICGSLINQYKQIGNAVPIALGEAIAKTIMAHKRGEAPPNYPGFPYSRYKRTNDLSWEKETRKQLANDGQQQLPLFALT